MGGVKAKAFLRALGLGDSVDEQPAAANSSARTTLHTLRSKSLMFSMDNQAIDDSATIGVSEQQILPIKTYRSEATTSVDTARGAAALAKVAIKQQQQPQPHQQPKASKRFASSSLVNHLQPATASSTAHTPAATQTAKAAAAAAEVDDASEVRAWIKHANKMFERDRKTNLLGNAAAQQQPTANANGGSNSSSTGAVNLIACVNARLNDAYISMRTTLEHVNRMRRRTGVAHSLQRNEHIAHGWLSVDDVRVVLESVLNVRIEPNEPQLLELLKKCDKNENLFRFILVTFLLFLKEMTRKMSQKNVILWSNFYL